MPKHYLTRGKVKKVIDKFLAMPREDLEIILADKKTSALELMIGSTIVSCIKAGDYSRLEALLSRAVGKVKEEIENDEENVDVKEEISKLSMHELLTLVKSAPKEKTE